MSFGQICGTPSYSNESFSDNQQKLNSVQAESQYMQSSTAICVNIKYHIVRQTNGTGGFDPSNLSNITNELNASFNEHKIYFNSAGHDFINNSTFFNIDDMPNNPVEFNALVQINNDPNAVNIYLVNDALSYAGRANGILSQALVIENIHAASQVISHEVGHCFNLYHTHHGTWVCERDSSTCIEIDGANNATCGDEVADTPADPGLLVFDTNCNIPLNSLVDASCNYTGGGGFNPDTNNIMSYAPVFCLEHFTNGQNTRMRQAFASSSTLQNVVGNSCSIPSLTGNSTVCYNVNTTYTLTNGGSNVTWEVSSALQIVSSSNTSITVKTLSAYQGSAYIRAILQYETIQKNITVNSSFNMTWAGPGPYGQVDVWITGGNPPYKFYRNNALIYTSYSSPTTIPFGCNGGILKVEASTICGVISKNDIIPSCNNYIYSVYPNPASTTLTVAKTESIDAQQFDTSNNEKSNKADSFELYDFDSNLILKGKLGTQTTIDASIYKKGRYILKISSGKESETHHIIVE